MPKYKATAYIRLSYTDDHSSESDSVSNQRKLIENFVERNPDIEVVSEKIDDGYSGIIFDRPAFKEMMQDVTDGNINCVIVKDLSRLGREYIETGRYLRRVFPAYGVRFIAITDSIDTVLVNAVGAVSATVNIVVTASFALIISVYMSVGSESLCHHARTLVCAYLKPSHSAWLLKFCRLFRQSFANFLTGQCSEAVILGVLMALAFSVFKIPYGSLVGMLTAICAIIPYVGALISCVVSVFLVLLVDPVLAVRCLIVYLAVQFIENQFIYPRVVGKSVGLSPLYTLVAAMIGGELFGIIGIIFFIPLTAVIIELVKEDACRRIQAREPQRSGPSE